MFAWHVKHISTEGGKGVGTNLILAEQTSDNVWWKSPSVLGGIKLHEMLMVLKIRADSLITEYVMSAPIDNINSKSRYRE